MKKTIGKLCVVTAIIGVGMVCQSVQAATKDYQDQLIVAGNKVKQINVKTESWNIEMGESDSSEVEVAVEGKQRDKKKVPVILKQQDHQLVIKQKDQKKGMFGGFSFGVEGTISIKVPKEQLEELTIQNDSGDLALDHISVDALNIDNQDGMLEIKGLTATSGDIQSNDGDASIKDSSIKNLTLHTVSGDLVVDDVSSETTKVLSKDGEVVFRNAVEGKRLSIESSTGDVNVSYKKVPTSLSVSAHTGSKDLEIGLEKFKLKKETKENKVGLLGKGENSLKVKSEKGAVSIK